jgi:hypothetical protein
MTQLMSIPLFNSCLLFGHEQVKEQFTRKYGREVTQRALKNEVCARCDTCVQESSLYCVIGDCRHSLDCSMQPFTLCRAIVAPVCGFQCGCVNPKVAEKLGVEPPSNYLIQSYLTEIATAFNVPWKPANPVSDW